MKMDGIKLFNGDAIEVMKREIQDGSVDLVLTDPPYNISKANGFASMGRAGIDFGEWDKDADLLSYIDEVRRILKPTGSFVVFNAWRNLGEIANYAESLGMVAKDVFRLEKTNPMPRNRDRRYITDYEFAIWFTNGGKWTFNRRHPSYERPKYVGSIESGLHPTQKNLGLMEHLVLIHSNPDELIVDPFSGSFTTGVACLNTGRKFIGIERDENFYKIGLKRMEKSLG
jgi:site-specific DNA-methyltransferase (adenine-specific)